LPDQSQHEQDGQTAQISGTVQIKQNGGNKQASSDSRQPDEEEAPEKKSGRKFIIIAVVILLVIGAGIFYWRSTFSEDTDDAQVDGDLYQVSSRVTGQVVKVYVEDNQQVKVGDPIAEIDPRDYQVALEQAEADLASKQAAAIQATVNVPITSVNVNTNVSTTGSDVQGTVASRSKLPRRASHRRRQMRSSRVLT
jgi:membrane fusion protein, multidrug efflux system